MMLWRPAAGSEIEVRAKSKALRSLGRSMLDQGTRQNDEPATAARQIATFVALPDRMCRLAIWLPTLELRYSTSSTIASFGTSSWTHIRLRSYGFAGGTLAVAGCRPTVALEGVGNDSLQRALDDENISLIEVRKLLDS